MAAAVGEEEFDVIVVGAGIMGSCSAYEAAKRGRRVLLLEQFDLLHHRGSSHGESRTIRATYPEPYYLPMVLESFNLWQQAEAEAGYSVLSPAASQLDFGPAGDSSLRLAVDNCQAAAIPVRVLRDPAEVSALFSGAFSLPSGWIAVLTDIAGVIKPTKAVSMFQSLAARRGAVLRDRAQVSDIRRKTPATHHGGGGGALIRVSTADGRSFLGRKCVVTAGAWMKKLVQAVAGRVLPISPLHTTICYWKIREGHEKDFSQEGGFPTFASYGDPYIYGTPSMEFPGLVKIALHGGYACDPDERNWVTEVGLLEKTVVPWIKELLPGKIEGDKPVMTQSCMYSMTPDGDFVIDFLGGELGEDVVIAGGFSGHGFKMGPLVGRILVDLALDGAAAGVDLRHFRLDRFDVNPRGNPKEFDDQVGSHAPPGQ
ncbi:unnamed protein product [Spirodela intermedia]|uniref:sarcosine oxidasee (formaldehyde-forming) n=1 Tax=Spirodela intermedia TaxID=51605 RepID=A0A7I8KNX6_SPIIN|nr:unnamed protein product [Spirodela intermedia]